MRYVESQEIRFEGPIEHLERTVGVLTDDDGNRFRVFVYGARQSDIERFIEQIGRGVLGIKVHVEPVESDVRGLDASAQDAGDGDEGPPASVRWGSVSVGISRWDLRVEPPYRITYTIDPYIYASNDPRDRFEVSFGGQDYADVLCSVDRGHVRVELIEYDAASQPFSHGSQDVTPLGGAVAMQQPKQGHGYWVVRVTSVAPVSYFTLRYNKMVTN